MTLYERALQVGEDLVDKIRMALKPWKSATVAREYAPKIDDAQFDAWIATQKSLGVFVIPLGLRSELATRGHDNVTYRYGVIFAEKCDEGGLPSLAWMDKRVTALLQVEEMLGDIRSWEESPLKPEESEITLMFDPDAYRLNHAFWGLWEISLNETCRRTHPIRYEVDP